MDDMYYEYDSLNTIEESAVHEVGTVQTPAFITSSLGTILIQWDP